MANDFSNERKAFQGALADAFTVSGVTSSRLAIEVTRKGAAVLVPIIFENQPMPKERNTPFARFSIRPGESFPAEIGRVMVRTVGIIYLQIFLPVDSGTDMADQAADQFADALNFKTLDVEDGQIFTGTTSLNYLGIDGASGMSQFNATNTYRRDVFRPEPA